MGDCIFCKIIGGEIPCYKIFENDYVVAFLDINPANPGHIDVIPREHYNTMLDLPEKILIEIIKSTQKIAQAVLKVIGTESFNLIVNTGKDAGQIVDHVHFHIIPRFKDDKRKFYIPPVKYKPGQKEEILEKIKKVLK